MLDRLEQQRIELVTEADVKSGNVGDHRGLRIERFAQPPDLGFQFGRGGGHRGKGNRTGFRNSPDETYIAAKIEREKGLVRTHGCGDLVHGWRFWIDQVGIGRKAAVDVVTRFLAVGAQLN